MSVEAKTVNTKAIVEQVYARGWYPIMVKKNGKVPIAPGWPKPLHKSELKIIDGCNVGILTGTPSKIVVVDVDIRVNGLNKWKILLEQNGDIKTYTVQTGSGGYHYYFNYSKNVSDMKNITGKSISIDFKTDGGQVVAAGSIHPDTKKVYTLINDAPLIDMPEWLNKLLRADSA